MSDLANFKQYWKLPYGFFEGGSLPDGLRSCTVIEDPGMGSSIRHLQMRKVSIFCTVGWSSNHNDWPPILDLRDAKSGQVVATVRKTSNGELYCPFDIESIIDAFRLERYTESTSRTAWLRHARQLYYRLKPLVPRGMQIKFRQLIAPLQGKRGFPDWPLDVSLDEFCQLFLWLILQASKVPRIPIIWFWPKGYSSCTVLTHDVETKNGYDNLWQIVDLERKYGFRSLWNFVPERYHVERQTLTDLASDGFEIGVHGLNHDGMLFDSCDTFKSRTVQINHYLQAWNSEGFRAPSAIRNIEWIASLIKATYDTSCPTSEIHTPQPGGCCSVFPFLIDQMVELPFTMPQDHTIFSILKDESEQIWFEVASKIMDQHGLINIIVHPDYLIDSNGLARYEAFLQWLQLQQQQHSIWVALPKEVAAWLKSRSQQQLRYDTSNWRVDGPETERSQIAYVSVTNHGLSFDIDEQAALDRQSL